MITDNHLEHCLDCLDDALTKFDRAIPHTVIKREYFRNKIQECRTIIEDVCAERSKPDVKHYFSIKEIREDIKNYAYLNFYYPATKGKEQHTFFGFIDVCDFLLHAEVNYSIFFRKKGN
jgi:hypothetical protein